MIRRRPARDLRTAIDCMPLETRRAMKDALAVNPIIVGAYTDRDGGVCPMLAAHRNGGRTSFASFAHAWDRYTRASGAPRRASEREVRALTTMLEASIALESVNGSGALGAAIADHQATQASRAVREERAAAVTAAAEPDRDRVARERPGDPDRSAELGGRHGWAWLRPFRRLDEYERALEQLDEVERQAERREREPV